MCIATCDHNEQQPTGNVPMVLTSSVSPPGSYSVRILASTEVEETVAYTITDTEANGED